MFNGSIDQYTNEIWQQPTPYPSLYVAVGLILLGTSSFFIFRQILKTMETNMSEESTVPQAKETQESNPTENFMANVTMKQFIAECHPPECREVKKDARRGRIWA